MFCRGITPYRRGPKVPSSANAKMHRIKGAGRFIINTYPINGHASHPSTANFKVFFAGDFSGVVATNLNTHCFSQYVGITREIFFTDSFYCTWKSQEPVTVTPEIVTPTLWSHRGRKKRIKTLRHANVCLLPTQCGQLFAVNHFTFYAHLLPDVYLLFCRLGRYTPKLRSILCRWRGLRLFRFASSFALCGAD